MCGGGWPRESAWQKLSTEQSSGPSSVILSTSLNSPAVSTLRPHLMLPHWSLMKTKWDKESQWAKGDRQFRNWRFSKPYKYQLREEYEGREVYKKLNDLKKSKLTHCFTISTKTKTSKHLVTWWQAGLGTCGQCRVEGHCTSSGLDCQLSIFHHLPAAWPQTSRLTLLFCACFPLQ